MCGLAVWLPVSNSKQEKNLRKKERKKERKRRPLYIDGKRLT
jgi:hypothetical protein